MKSELKKQLLRALNEADGLPFPESALAQAAKQMVRPAEPTNADVTDALRACEREAYVLGVTDDFAQERTWTLTEKGKHKARQLQ
jgi:hypothetical protein